MADNIQRVATAIARLSIQRSSPLDEYQVSVYTDALTDCDVDQIESACNALGLQERSEHEPAMPSVGAIRKTIKHIALVERVGQKAIPSASSDDARTWFTCFACEDNNWLILSCPGGAKRVCGRPDKGRFQDVGDGRTAFFTNCEAPHDYAIRCDHRLRPTSEPSVEWSR